MQNACALDLRFRVGSRNHVLHRLVVFQRVHFHFPPVVCRALTEANAKKASTRQTVQEIAQQ
jgi:hypothetical protein